MKHIVCFGEVLWDVFPDKRRIGGAPLNVALRLNSFNHQVTVVSAIGEDILGTEVLSYLEKNQLDTSFIQITDAYHTGEVEVLLNKKGSATYIIKHPSAWDKIKLTEAVSTAVKKADALVFGSLITRDNVSKNTLYNLIEYSNYNIFDLNLRPPHYSKDVLVYLMQKADFIKFNDDELYEVAAMLNSKYNSLEQHLRFIAEQTKTAHICVTKGAHGAVLLYNGMLYYNSGYQINVKDTVGAGDSFLASLVSKLLMGALPQKAVVFACGVGAMVAQSEGANPKLNSKAIEAFINP